MFFLDAIHYKIKDEWTCFKPRSLCCPRCYIEGNKDILGIWIEKTSLSKFWLGIMNDLKNRGVQDILLFCVDGLTGLKEAINAAFPKSEDKRVLSIHYAIPLKYVSYKDIKAFSKILRKLPCYQ